MKDDLYWKSDLRAELPNYKTVSSFKVLNLSHNKLTSYGITELAYSLTDDTYVRSLILRANAIDSKGVRAIDKMFALN